MLCLLMAASIVYADTSIINVYDANGNLVTGDGRYYEYNDANQLAKVRQGDQAGPVIAEYFYDASGQRVKKIENGVVTYYVGKHFEKQVGGSNEGSTSYYFADDGERVAKKDSAGNIFYYHLDHLDGVNAVTDSAGTLVSRTDYLPFGEAREGSSGSEKYAYTGKEKDKTDLYYFDARYNSPEFKHFTQADIAEPDYDDPQDLNRYSYVGNNPLSYVDEDGFKKKKRQRSQKEKSG
jgi:RHS repeat-associated protein